MNNMSPISNNRDETIPRREREKMAHRQEILDAATRVFAQKGFFNATLEEIAQEAEFSKGAVYLYFSSKEDLMYNIMKENVSGIMKLLKYTLTGEKSLKEELGKIFKKIAELAFREKDFFSIFVTQHIVGFRAVSSEKAEEFCAMHKKFDEIMINRIVKAIEEGELRDIEPNAVNGVIREASRSMMVNRWDFETLEELQEAVDVFLDILFNGIGKKKEVGSEQ